MRSVPRPCWRYSASTRKNDAWPAPEHSWRDQPGGERRGRANSAGASSGCAAAAGQPALVDRERASRMTGAAASDSHVHSGQPWARPSTSGSTIAVRPAVTSGVPATSIRPPAAARDSGMNERPGASARAPIGTLIRKHGAPAQPGEVGLTSSAADQLAGDRGQTHRHAVGGQRPGRSAPSYSDADQRQHVGHQQRRGAALDEPGDRRAGRGSGEAAGRGAEGEQRQPESRTCAGGRSGRRAGRR